ncbi:acetyl-CoA synthetase-like protein [Parathielavia appendiculata]|uniref:Very long-chain fatty acid transport protein n=1 Tax=Parathielavia appendiculata TaxID=2587402 RepID=A0AAN6Z443_9PEZI|nr:acetyl-CoA synthetase-like protein [Parathielavia appendiculata]
MAPSPLPLSITLPAVAAAAAYLNAKTLFSYDLNLLASIIPTIARTAWWKNRGRLNFFYRLEDLATSKSTENRVFLRFEDKTYTYAQAYDTILRYADWLKKRRGVHKGEMVALDFQNTDTFVFLLFALWALGAVPALINYNLTGKPLAHCVKKAKARLVLIDPVVAGNVGEDVRSELSQVSFEVVTPETETQMLSHDAARPPDEDRANVTPDGMGILIYTSGTTGLPKAAIVSWAKIAVVGGFTSRWIGTKKNDVFYTAMPLYHSTAMLLGFAHALSVGATFAMSRKFSTSSFWDDVRKHNANIIQYVGETCRYLLSAPTRSDPVTGESLDRKHNVRVAFGNGLRPDVWNQFKERFGIKTIAEFYGATEGSFATWNLSRNDYSMGAIGRSGTLSNILIGRSIAVVEVEYDTELPLRDPKTGFCRRVPHGEPGELLFRLPPKDVESRFQGYYGDKEATSKKIMFDVLAKGDAWFRTGDVVRWDAEGRVYFNDRIGDTFRWKSENVSTAEVAHVVGLHPAVLEANVYGVEVPGHEGRAGCAAVVFKPEALSASSGGGNGGGAGLPSDETLRTLASHVRAGLPKYALPLFVRVVNSGTIQATGTNKQQKMSLRKEGVEPGKTGTDDVFWLRGNSYVRFRAEDWKALQGGKVRL